jgi:succinate dehydrogenase / fumarate reductase membrane anchor subunit
MLTSAPKPSETTWLWLLKLVTGALVFILIFVHIIVNHLVSSSGLLTYHDVAVYLSNPWIDLMESTFLVVVVTHALLGVRSVILDLRPSQTVVRAIDWIFSAAGIVAIVYGIWLIRLIASRAGGG